MGSVIHTSITLHLISATSYVEFLATEAAVSPSDWPPPFPAYFQSQLNQLSSGIIFSVMDPGCLTHIRQRNTEISVLAEGSKSLHGSMWPSFQTLKLMWKQKPKLRQIWGKEELRQQNEKPVTQTHGAKSEGRENVLHKRKWQQSKTVLRPRRRTFWGFSVPTVLTFLMCWIWFAIYFHYKLLLSALCPNSVFSNVSLCLSLGYIEIFAVRDITWFVTTWLVFMAAISEVVLSNQPHASSDIGEAGILLLSMDAGGLGVTGMGENRNSKAFLVPAVLLGVVGLVYWFDYTFIGADISSGYIKEFKIDLPLQKKHVLHNTDIFQARWPSGEDSSSYV